MELSYILPLLVLFVSDILQVSLRLNVLGVDPEGEVCVQMVAVYRTARRLSEGNVFY